MRQVLQNLRTGRTEVVEVPAPQPATGRVIVRTSTTLISAGTERMLVEFGRAGWLDKARQQPDRVRQVLEKARSDGLLATASAVLGKLDQPIPLGYCNVGRVIAVGDGVVGFSPGMRVVSNGGHADVVSVGSNLCAPIPDGVSDDAAVFTVLAAIGLQGIRLAQPTLGECVVVTGLGLIGLLTVQLLRAQGCRVLGIDRDVERLRLAQELGAAVVDLSRGEDPVAAATAFSRGRGVDAVLIAAATDSNEPVAQAAKMCRKRGRIVLIGVAGLQLTRSDFFEKELSFQVSCSYGPGRYDPTYEERGVDYPIGYVRWTEQRNFEAVLDMMAAGSIDVAPLISHRFPVAEAPQAYDLMLRGEPSLGILLSYGSADSIPEAEIRTDSVSLRPAAPTTAPGFGIVGAGNYAAGVLIPALKRAGARLVSVGSRGGVSAAIAARRHGAESATSNIETLLSDTEVHAVVVATRHDTHARLVCDALNAGKHVFVEKPLALTMEELDDIERLAARPNAPLVMVGFNRRFAPLAVRMRSLAASLPEPRSFVALVNAGELPATHWAHDREVGGGRILGEACHFVDLLRFLAGSAIVDVDARSMAGHPGLARGDDKASLFLRFEDGSTGVIHYFANGHKSFPKERIELFSSGRVLQLDNFRSLRGWGWSGRTRQRAWRQDKGHDACAAAFVRAVSTGGPSPIPLEELLEVSRATIKAAELTR